jgi:hypothetical protein
MQDGSGKWPTAAGNGKRQREIASSSSNVVKEGDGGYERRVKESFVRRGLGLSYIACQQPLGKKKSSTTAQGELEPESRRRDDDA